MNITIPFPLLIAWALSLPLLIYLLKPRTRRTWYDFDALFDVLWIIPLLLIWLLYFVGKSYGWW